MRRYQKRQIEEFIHLLKDAHDSIRKALCAGERSAALTLLAQCQRGAISLGTLIESVEGGETPTVALLEDYCEQVYQCCEAVRREAQAMSGSRIHKILRKSLFSIEKSAECHLKARLEVVFFPYKASMWDSLESIWRAAEADPDCDAYVVPIPYYEKNPDGGLRQMHYDGNYYPSYVPVVDWRTYDLEKQQPDAAFIHNPYDDQNLVTQVHEMYFSRNLKKHVGLLCYIPYFVAARGASSHFAYMPGVINSDFTIVENEKVRQDYLAVWEQLVNQGQAAPNEGRNIESRILALGSPKYDAVFNAGKEDFTFPDEWKQLLDSDGSRKKVFLYNTSISTMLEHTLNERGEVCSRYLRKIESVLRYFKQRNDVVLLWRPHPLMEQTLTSMRPEIYEDYCKIVRDYKEANYGIYDDSANLQRALAVSDAYYGDRSSVMYLWEKTGKPLLINHIDITSYRHHLVFMNLHFDGVRFWCTAADFNGLFWIERDTWKVRFAGLFPNEKKEGCRLYGAIAECGGKLYFAPWCARNIAVYDKRTGKFSSLPLPLEEEARRNLYKYFEVLTYQEFVYLIGNQVNTILRIDTRTEEITVMDGWKHELKPCEADRKEPFFSGACQEGATAYVFSRYANAMLRLDLSSGLWKLIRFPGGSKGYCRGVCVKGRVWFCSNYEASAGVYDPASGQFSELEVPNLFARGFNCMQAYHENIYCFSPHCAAVLKINADTYQMQVYRCAETCQASVVDGKYAYIVSELTGKLQRLDLETMESHAEDILCAEMPARSGRSILEGFRSQKRFAPEDAYLNLDTLVAITQNVFSSDAEKPEHIGETIYQYIKKVIP